MPRMVAEGPAPPGTPRAAWTALGIVTVAHAAGSFAMLGVAPLAPFLVDALGLTRAQVGLFVPAAYLGGVLMSLPSGWLTDALGVRLTLGLGLVLIGLMVGTGASTSSLPVTLGCLVIGGFGFSVLNPATGKAIVDWFPPRRGGRGDPRWNRRRTRLPAATGDGRRRAGDAAARA